jgi:hypothetical protein
MPWAPTSPWRGIGIQNPTFSGYKVHYGSVNHPYPSFIDAGNASTQVINNLQEGVTYYFAVTAYDVDGQESDFSGEISYTVPLRGISAVGDGSFRVRFQGVPGLTYRIEYTESLTTPNWRSLGLREAGANGSFEISIGRSPAHRWASIVCVSCT